MSRGMAKAKLSRNQQALIAVHTLGAPRARVGTYHLSQSAFGTGSGWEVGVSVNTRADSLGQLRCVAVVDYEDLSRYERLIDAYVDELYKDSAGETDELSKESP